MAKKLHPPRAQTLSFLGLCHANWWVIGFLTLLALFSWQSVRNKRSIQAELLSKFYSIEEAISLAKAERDDLFLQKSSHNDPEWIDLVLRRRLGLVPEGQVKVYFEKSIP